MTGAKFISMYDEHIDMLCAKRIDKQQLFEYN